MSNYRSMCMNCAHLYSDGSDEYAQDEAPARCEAFPGGIPDEILREGFDHRQEFPGDGGVRFEPIENPVKSTMEAFGSH